MKKEVEYSLFRAVIRISTFILVLILIVFFINDFFFERNKSYTENSSGDLISMERDILVSGNVVIDDMLRINNFNITPTSILTFYASDSKNSKGQEMGSTRIHSGNIRFDIPEETFNYVVIYNQENTLLAYAEIKN